jgi:hypothetical protein
VQIGLLTASNKSHSTSSHRGNRMKAKARVHGNKVESCRHPYSFVRRERRSLPPSLCHIRHQTSWTPVCYQLNHSRSLFPLRPFLRSRLPLSCSCIPSQPSPVHHSSLPLSRCFVCLIPPQRAQLSPLGLTHLRGSHSLALF